MTGRLARGPEAGSNIWQANPVWSHNEGATSFHNLYKRNHVIPSTGTSPTNHRVSMTSGMMIQNRDDKYALIGFVERPQATSVPDGKDVWLAGEERTFFAL